MHIIADEGLADTITIYVVHTSCYEVIHEWGHGSLTNAGFFTPDQILSKMPNGAPFLEPYLSENMPKHITFIIFQNRITIMNAITFIITATTIIMMAAY